MISRTHIKKDSTIVFCGIRIGNLEKWEIILNEHRSIVSHQYKSMPDLCEDCLFNSLNVITEW